MGCVDALLCFGMFHERKIDWNILGAIFFLSCLAAFIIMLNQRYTVAWNGRAVVQTAFGKRLVSICPGAITKIRFEISDTRALFAANRPYRRVAIYAGDEFIDVSMKHFKLDDIRKLIGILRGARPDLSIGKLPKSVLRK